MKELTKLRPKPYLWLAGVWHDIPEELDLTAEPLTAPLRCAPVILREVQPGIDKATDGIHNYSDNGLPAPADGLSVVRLSHHGDGHVNPWPIDCVKCGKNVAAELRHLCVGKLGE